MILEIILNLLKYLQYILHYGIYLSYTIGEILVKFIVITINIIFKVLINSLSGVIIVLEEFRYFLNEITELCETIITKCVQTYQNLAEIFPFLTKISIITCNFLTESINIVINTFNVTFITIPKFVINLGGEVIKSFGIGFLFLLTLIPNGITASYELITFFKAYIRSRINKIYNNENLIHYLLGLILIITILYCYRKFKCQLFRYFNKQREVGKFHLKRIGLRIYQLWQVGYLQLNGIVGRVYVKLERFRVSVYRYTVGYNERLPQRRVRTSPKVVDAKKFKEVMKKIEKMEEEKLCVVCQENHKNVLILPCKHLCMCDQCADRIIYTNGSCPICRSYVNNVIQRVFI